MVGVSFLCWLFPTLRTFSGYVLGWEILLITRIVVGLPSTQLGSHLPASILSWSVNRTLVAAVHLSLSYLSSTHQNPTLVLFSLTYRLCDILLYMHVFLCMLVYLHATAWKKRLKGYIATVSSFLWLTMFCHKMLSKSSSNPEAQIFMLQE